MKLDTLGIRCCRNAAVALRVRRAASYALCFTKGGLPNGYILGFDPNRYPDRWNHRPVSTGKKEVIAGTLRKFGDHIKQTFKG